jgi:hypothetical protein
VNSFNQPYRTWWECKICRVEQWRWLFDGYGAEQCAFLSVSCKICGRRMKHVVQDVYDFIVVVEEEKV